MSVCVCVWVEHSYFMYVFLYMCIQKQSSYTMVYIVGYFERLKIQKKIEKRSRDKESYGKMFKLEVHTTPMLQTQEVSPIQWAMQNIFRHILYLVELPTEPKIFRTPNQCNHIIRSNFIFWVANTIFTSLRSVRCNDEARFRSCTTLKRCSNKYPTSTLVKKLRYEKSIKRTFTN